MRYLIVFFAFVTAICFYILFQHLYQWIQNYEQKFKEKQIQQPDMQKIQEQNRQATKMMIHQHHKLQSQREEERRMYQQSDLPRPFTPPPLPNCFLVLGFHAWPESQQEIKTHFRELAKQYHPDAGGDTRKFQEISAAYEEAMRLLQKN